jgi:hypothetical protein
MCVKKIVSILLGLVPEVATAFFKEIHFNDSDCNALIRAKGMLSKQEKRGSTSSEPVL